MSERSERRDAGHPLGLRYPGWALAVAVVAVVVAIGNVSSVDYGDGEGAAVVIDFALALVVTFLFWYGVVLAVGWVARKVAGAGRST